MRRAMGLVVWKSYRHPTHGYQCLSEFVERAQLQRRKKG